MPGTLGPKTGSNMASPWTQGSVDTGMPQRLDEGVRKAKAEGGAQWVEFLLSIRGAQCLSPSRA